MVEYLFAEKEICIKINNHLLSYFNDISMPTGTSILQFKITLIGSKPAIWRRIAVPADYSFFDLHVAIQNAFGWYDSHLHQFFTTEPYKRSRDYQCIAYPMPEMDDVLDERKEKLSAWYKNPKDTLWYEYDFGDSWMHKVTLEKILPKDKGTTYPTLLGGKYACPPEDCGGVPGYYNLLETLRNPQDEEHQDMLEWLDIESADAFDPEAFDEKSVRFDNPKRRLREFEDAVS